MSLLGSLTFFPRPLPFPETHGHPLCAPSPSSSQRAAPLINLNFTFNITLIRLPTAFSLLSVLPQHSHYNDIKMSAQTAPASSNPADGPKFEIVHRLDGVPAVHDTIAYAQSWIQATSLTASLYSTAVGVANKSYEIATPVLTKTKPLLESVDGLAVATFDRAEATFPYPFKTATQDLIFVKQARGIYGATVQPVIETAQPLVVDVYHKTVSINTYLIQRAEQTVASSGDLGHNLVEQLKYLASHGKELPSELIHAVTQTSHDLKEIVFDKDITLGDKSNRVSAYVVDKVKPIVDEVYNYVLGAKKKAEEQANATAQRASETVDQVTQAAQS